MYNYIYICIYMYIYTVKPTYSEHVYCEFLRIANVSTEPRSKP